LSRLWDLLSSSFSSSSSTISNGSMSIAILPVAAKTRA